MRPQKLQPELSSKPFSLGPDIREDQSLPPAPRRVGGKMGSGRQLGRDGGNNSDDGLLSENGEGQIGEGVGERGIENAIKVGNVSWDTTRTFFAYYFLFLHLVSTR